MQCMFALLTAIFNYSFVWGIRSQLDDIAAAVEGLGFSSVGGEKEAKQTKTQTKWKLDSQAEQGRTHIGDRGEDIGIMNPFWHFCSSDSSHWAFHMDTYFSPLMSSNVVPNRCTCQWA